MSKISVIVPAYNASNNIRECLDSLINQEYRDLEIILVDDCSNDDTYSIMQEYAERDSRIKTIKTDVNSGAGVARNKGLEIAIGEYVTFVDSDDFLALDTYKKVNETIIRENNPDIVRFDQHCFLDCGKLRININFLSNNIFNGKPWILNPKSEQLYVALENPGVCNKVFKRSLIDETRFVEGKKWEDYPFCTFLLGKASQVVIIDGGKYYYRYSLKHKNTTLGDVKNPSEQMLEIYDCCDFLEKEYRDADIFEDFSKSLRSNQKIRSLQRVRDVTFSKAFSKNQKKELINALINLTEVKYGEVFNDAMYLHLKSQKNFYNARMSIVEKFYSDETMRQDKSETGIREKIKRMF